MALKQYYSEKRLNIIATLINSQRLNKQQVKLLIRDKEIFKVVVSEGESNILAKIPQELIDNEVERFLSSHTTYTLYDSYFFYKLGYRISPEMIDKLIRTNHYAKVILPRDNIKFLPETIDYLIDERDERDVGDVILNIALLCYYHFRELSKEQIEKIVHLLYENYHKPPSRINTIMEEKVSIGEINRILNI